MVYDDDMSDFVTEARRLFGSTPFTASEAVKGLPRECLPAVVQRKLSKGSNAAYSLGRLMRNMPEVSVAAQRTSEGILWQLKADDRN